MLNTLSADNKRWLASKLIESASHEATTSRIQYPHISKTRKVSKETLGMVIGKLPQDCNWDKETEQMWKEMAQ